MTSRVGSDETKADAIKAALREPGASPSDIARRFHTSRSQVYRLRAELADTGPTARRVLALAVDEAEPTPISPDALTVEDRLDLLQEEFAALESALVALSGRVRDLRNVLSAYTSRRGADVEVVVRQVLAERGER